MVRAMLGMRRPHSLQLQSRERGRMFRHRCCADARAIAELELTPGSCCGTRVSHHTFLCHLLAQHPSEPVLGVAMGKGNGTSHMGLSPDASWTLALHPSSPPLPLSPYLETKKRIKISISFSHCLHPCLCAHPSLVPEASCPEFPGFGSLELEGTIPPGSAGTVTPQRSLRRAGPACQQLDGTVNIYKPELKGTSLKAWSRPLLPADAIASVNGSQKKRVGEKTADTAHSPSPRLEKPFRGYCRCNSHPQTHRLRAASADCSGTAKPPPSHPLEKRICADGARWGKTLPAELGMLPMPGCWKSGECTKGGWGPQPYWDLGEWSLRVCREMGPEPRRLESALPARVSSE